MSSKLKMKDGPGKLPIQEMRRLFENAVTNTEKLQQLYPLAILKTEGGMRTAQRIEQHLKTCRGEND